MKIAIISHRNIINHVAIQPVVAFENALKDISGGKLYSPYRYLVSAKFKSNGLIDMSCFSRYLVDIYRPDAIFCTLMNPQWCRILKYFHFDYTKSKLILYIIDTWESYLSDFDKMIKDLKVDYLFVAYKELVSHFSSEFKIPVEWLPLAADTRIFKDWGEEKTYDVYAMGRRHEPHHRVLKKLAEEGKLKYLFNERGKKCHIPIECSPIGLAMLINRSRFFLVSPQDIMEESYDATISPIVPRYFEGIACKAMLIGIRPRSGELEELFPFDNVMVDIDIEGAEFYEKIKYYISHNDEYQCIVDRNYEHLHDNHSYKNRAEKVLSSIVASLTF